MTMRWGLSAVKRYTSCALRTALGDVLHQEEYTAPLQEFVDLGGKIILYASSQTWLDGVVSELANGTSLKPIHPRLRTDTAHAAAGGRKRWADQSTSRHVLAVCPTRPMAQLLTATEPIDRRVGQALPPPFAQERLCLDLDLTALPIGRYAAANTLGRVSALSCLGVYPVD